MTGLGVVVRWAHLAPALCLVGVFTFMLLAGRSDRPTARAWEGQVLRLTRWLLGALLLSGIGVLAHQAAIATGRGGALVEPSSWLRVLLDSHFGTVWLVRHGFLILLAALVLFREREVSASDWIGWRVEACGLAVVGTAAMAWAGHAIAVEPGGRVAVLADALHITAAGAWLGALPPLVLLLRAGSREAGADARPFAVLAVRRFSVVALLAMLTVAATGLWNAWTQVASVPALVATRYGQLLLVKLALLAPIVALASANRRLLPALSGDAASIGRPAMARLARFAAAEGLLALAILAVTSSLSLTPPARHDSPDWPFAHRLAYEVMADLPGVKGRLLVGSQLAILGLLAAVVSVLVKQRRVLLLGAGAGTIILGLWVALPPLAIDAYPTTYRRPAVPYEAVSIASGGALYATHCARCHGRGGTGDGPSGAGLPRRPADLTGPHTGQHTAGDLFWWLTHGIPAAGMPSFGGALSEEERWDLINFLRALSAAHQARALGPVIEANRPWLAAPDFTFAVGPTPVRSLRELRGRAMVLLVVFSLPDSLPRLGQLAEIYSQLQFLGLEVIAVSTDGDPRVLRRLGGEPPVLFPVATEGGPAIVSAYTLFRRALDPESLLAEPPAPRHMELLIDRQGYIRARWIPGAGGKGWSDLELLRGEIQRLDHEGPAAPPEEHVH